MTWLLILTIVLFVGVGLWVQEGTRTFDGYVLGNRQIPWFLVAGSLAATDIGAGSSFGLIQQSANGDGLGTALFIWMMIPSYLIGSLLGPAMRASGAKTIPDYFEMRYGASSRIVSALLVAIPTLGIVAVNLTVAANVLNALTTLPVEGCYVLVTIVTVLYTYVGGLWVDAITDAIQMILILGGVVLAAVFFHLTVCPIEEVIAEKGDQLLPASDVPTAIEVLGLLALYSANFLVGLSTITRIYAGESGMGVRKGILSCLPLYLIYGICPALLGIYLQKLPSSPDQFTPNDVVALLVHNLPASAMLVLAAGLISAMLSTVDTLLLGSASIVVHDLIRPLSGNRRDDRREMQLTRGLVIILGMAAALVSFLAVDKLLSTLFLVLRIQASALFAPFVFGHFHQRLRSWGANLVIVTTAVSFFAFRVLIPSSLSLIPFLLAIALNSGLFWGLTWLTPKEIDQQEKP